MANIKSAIKRAKTSEK
nr:RecName: Full=Small ribosomal subunit protein bS20; AltName: Full=30S ribosomal protein S20; Short=BS20 [Geobacillus stearothermophilus]